MIRYHILRCTAVALRAVADAAHQVCMVVDTVSYRVGGAAADAAHKSLTKRVNKAWEAKKLADEQVTAAIYDDGVSEEEFDVLLYERDQAEYHYDDEAEACEELQDIIDREVL